ncbi:helix-turn-helix domain-containing protein [uncultured Kocuria sp.]|uniref:helix-turn-helix domain-containing protein n=1 Tax=uncultured Kocuria sp. TaxID=259305 RepID=UPI0025991C00|nr:helix-turn-helix transcriptional regulator [uncultured Kocuria sp.]MCT1367359.1 helix-turn-helix transcriptional regulator [Rothia sp. p3-SID1597]
MARKNENVREFLATRRAKVTPEEVGIPRGNGVRRVPGLRREEVAMLSGVSVDYYTRIEKGDLTGVSDVVLDAVAQTLRLDDDEYAYLYDLARATQRPARARPTSRTSTIVPQQVQLLIDSMSATPVIALSRRLDVLAANGLGRALFDVVYSSPTRRSAASAPNLASFVFLDPAAAGFYDDLDDAAATCVKILRAQAGATPHDKKLAQLVGELSTRSSDFSALWAAHDVGVHRSGRKVLHHHEVEELALGFEELTLDSAPSIVLSAYIAEPASPTAERLQLLAAWEATEARSSATDDVDSVDTYSSTGS